MSAAAVITLRRKRWIRAFREARATEPSRAITLEQLGQHRSWIFDQMAGHGVFTASGKDRYYLNEPVAEEFLAARRKRALIFTGVMALIFAVLWLLGQLKP